MQCPEYATVKLYFLSCLCSLQIVSNKNLLKDELILNCNLYFAGSKSERKPQR